MNSFITETNKEQNLVQKMKELGFVHKLESEFFEFFKQDDPQTQIIFNNLNDLQLFVDRLKNQIQVSSSK